MGCVRFLLKAVTVYSREKEGFNYKNNHGHGKSANFRLDNISKMNCRILVVWSYTSPDLASRNVQLI